MKGSRRVIGTKLLSCWIFITVFTRVGFGQDIASTIDLADYFFQNKEYEQALSLYSRVVFFDSDMEYDHRTIPSIALCSYHTERWSKAAEYFLLAFTRTQKDEYYLLHVISLVKADRLMEAKSALLGLRDGAKSLNTSRGILLGLVAYRNGQFEEAKKYLDNLTLPVDAHRSHMLENIWKATSRVARKSKTKAILLSGIVPGLGQVYANDIKAGVNSFVLLTAFGAVYFFVVKNIGIIDGIVSVLPWYHRYYSGGLNVAGRLLEEHKEEKYTELYNKLVEVYSEYIEY